MWNRFNNRQICLLNRLISTTNRIDSIRPTIGAGLSDSCTTPNANRTENLLKKCQSTTDELVVKLQKNQRLDDKAKHLLDEIDKLCDEIKELELIQHEDESELRDLIDEDLAKLDAKFNEIKWQLVQQLCKETYLTDELTMEFENGVGGNEAMIFTKQMVDFYIQYCRDQNWSVNMIEFELSNGKFKIELF